VLLCIKQKIEKNILNTKNNTKMNTLIMKKATAVRSSFSSPDGTSRSYYDSGHRWDRGMDDVSIIDSSIASVLTSPYSSIAGSSNTLIMMQDIPSQEENKLSEKGWCVFSNLQDEKTRYFYKERDNKDNFWENMIISNLSKDLSKDIENNTIIVAYDKDTNEELEKFRTQGETSRQLGVNQGSISGSINKGYIVSGKYIFKELKNQPPLEKSFEEKFEELEKNSRKVGKTESFTLNGKRKEIRKHRLILFHIKKEKFVCKCCNKTPEQESRIDCDHIDGNHENNNPDNLQPLCKSCHAKKTNEQTSESRKKQKGIPILVEKKYKDGEIKYTKEFISISECRRYYNEKSENDEEKFCLHDSAFSNKKPIYERTFKNFILKFEIINDFLEDDENGKEEWRSLDFLEKFKGKNRFVSNYGRIKYHRGIANRSLEENYYRYAGFRVHQLVLYAFELDNYRKKALEIQKKYPDISIEDIMNNANEKYSIVVDHENGVKIDNRLSNLRFFTLIENARNTSTNYKVCQYSMTFELLGTFGSVVEAAEKIGINANGINRACNDKDRKTYKGIIFMKKDHIDKFENPKDAYIDLKGQLPDHKNNTWTEIREKYINFYLKNKKKPSAKKKDSVEKSLGIWFSNNNRDYTNNKMSEERKTLWLELLKICS